MSLLYFAWVRQRVGKVEEIMALPADVKTVSDLIMHLKRLGPGYADAFADESRIRVAVNQRHARFDAAIDAEDEVAFFPPVTGG